jgi:hypothetical protein
MGNIAKYQEVLKCLQLIWKSDNSSALIKSTATPKLAFNKPKTPVTKMHK